MVVVGAVDEVGIIDGLIPAEVDFPQQLGFHQQREGPVECGSGGGLIELAGHLPKFVGREVLVGSQSCLDDHFTLPGAPQSFGIDEGIDAFLDFWIELPGHGCGKLTVRQIGCGDGAPQG